MKMFIRIFLASSLIIGMLYSTFSFYRDINSEPVYRSGLITWKGSTEEANKHSSRINFIFVVDFDKIGKEDAYVSASTYSSYSVGDRISLPKYRSIGLNIIPAVITILIFGVFLICIAAETIYWIITGENLC